MANNKNAVIKQNPTHALLLASVAELCFVGVTKPSLAQSSPSEKIIEIEEIVVTAQKRTQNLRDVPISITAIGADELKRLGGDKFSEFLVGVAGVAAIDQGSDFTNVVVRGVTTAVEGEGDEGAVAIYFDELPLGGGNGGVQLKPVDIERIEVLRGPQATLYGAGSLSGTLRLVPAKPDLSYIDSGGEVGISKTRGARGTNYDVNGYLNLPIVNDIFGVRAVVYADDEKGFVENVRTRDYVGRARTYGGRLSALVKPSENFSLSGNYAYQEQKSNGAAQYLPLFASDNGLTGFKTPRNSERNFRRNHLAGLTLNADLGDILFTATTGYRDSLNAVNVDFSVTSLIVGGDFGVDLFETTRTKSWSNEVRLSSESDGLFNYVFGAYYEQRRTSEKTIVTRLDNGLIFDGYPLGSPVQLRTSKFRDISIFGEIGYKITPKIEITGGLRQTWFDIRGTRDESLASSVQSQKKPKSTNPQFNITYKPSSNQTFFARLARGFRAPDVVFADSSCDTSTLPFKGVLQPDSLNNYEIGSKSRFAEGKVLLNASAYLVDWKNVPVFITPDGCTATTRTNGGRARSYGIEAEITARITQNLTLNTSATYSVQKLRSVLPGFSGGIPGDKLPGTADVRLNIGLSYDRKLNEAVSGFITTSLTYVGPYSNEFPAGFTSKIKVFNPIPVRIKGLNGNAPIDPAGTDVFNFISGDYALANVRLGLKGEKWSVSAYVNNITDGGRNVLLAPNVADGTFEYAFIPAKPRTIGLDFSVYF